MSIMIIEEENESCGNQKIVEKYEKIVVENVNSMYVMIVENWKGNWVCEKKILQNVEIFLSLVNVYHDNKTA